MGRFSAEINRTYLSHQKNQTTTDKNSAGLTDVLKARMRVKRSGVFFFNSYALIRARFKMMLRYLTILSSVIRSDAA